MNSTGTRSYEAKISIKIIATIFILETIIWLSRYCVFLSTQHAITKCHIQAYFGGQTGEKGYKVQ